MSPEVEEKLIADFPALLRREKLYSFQCDDGWEPLIRSLCEKLTMMVENLPEKMREDYYAEVIKQKFGGLRFYMSHQTPVMNEAIAEAEKKSFQTCETCGAPGKRRRKGHYWIYTSCDEHMES